MGPQHAGQRARTRCGPALPAWTPSACGAGSGRKNTTPTCWPTSRTSWTAESQTDPRFRTDRLYTRLSAAEVRRQLIRQKGYTDEEAPAVRTINDKLNQLGYRPTKVAKCRPKKTRLARITGDARSA